jgi:hypothetical protein
MRVSVELGRQLNRRSHEFRTYDVNNRLRKDPINLGHRGRVDTPPSETGDRGELVRPPGAPKRDARILPVENPAQGEMDDAPSKIDLREAIEPFNCLQILRKSRRLELGVVLSKIIARKLRLGRHPAGEKTPAQGAVRRG